MEGAETRLHESCVPDNDVTQTETAFVIEMVTAQCQRFQGSIRALTTTSTAAPSRSIPQCHGCGASRRVPGDRRGDRVSHAEGVLQKQSLLNARSRASACSRSDRADGHGVPQNIIRNGPNANARDAWIESEIEPARWASACRAAARWRAPSGPKLLLRRTRGVGMCVGRSFRRTPDGHSRAASPTPFSEASKQSALNSKGEERNARTQGRTQRVPLKTQMN